MSDADPTTIVVSDTAIQTYVCAGEVRFTPDGLQQKWVNQGNGSVEWRKVPSVVPTEDEV